MGSPRRHIFIISFPDRAGIIAAVSGFIARHGGFIIQAIHHID